MQMQDEPNNTIPSQIIVSFAFSVTEDDRLSLVSGFKTERRELLRVDHNGARAQIN